tara:strand:- start:515 stop:700 length:186 start_codon:yes stop_codon:yes gene_type:complete
MTYTILSKYQNIGGDWSVSVKKDEYTLSYLFNSEPTDEMIAGRISNFVKKLEEEKENVIEE